MHLGPEHLSEQLVSSLASTFGWSIAGEHEMHLDPEPAPRSSRHPAVVRLSCSNCHDRARAVGEGLATEELKLAGLVPAAAEPGEIITLDPKPRP